MTSILFTEFSSVYHKIRTTWKQYVSIIEIRPQSYVYIHTTVIQRLQRQYTNHDTHVWPLVSHHKIMALKDVQLQHHLGTKFIRKPWEENIQLNEPHSKDEKTTAATSNTSRWTSATQRIMKIMQNYRPIEKIDTPTLSPLVEISLHDDFPPLINRIDALIYARSIHNHWLLHGSRNTPFHCPIWWCKNQSDRWKIEEKTLRNPLNDKVNQVQVQPKCQNNEWKVTSILWREMDVKNGDRFWQLEISGLQQFDGIFFCTQCIKHISNNHKLYQSSPNSSYDQKDVREKLHNCFFIERKTSKKSARPRFCEIQRLIN